MKQFRDTPYYITEDGKVFRHYPKRKWINSQTHNGKKYEYLKLQPEKYKELKPGIQSSGYKQVVLHEGFSKPTSFRVHRLVAECYIGICPEGYEVDHINGDKVNNNISNLQYLTKEENIRKG